MTSTSGQDRIPVAVLGATGMVGQRIVSLLADHPWFALREVIASERSAGRSYGEAVDWRLEGDPPPPARDLVVRSVEEAMESPVAFSGLGSDIAGPIEERLAAEGRIVISNAGSHRMDEDVPLLVPEVNPDHVEAVTAQKKRRAGRGWIVTNPNCSTIGLVLALAPLHRAFGLRRVLVVTMQAISGAGYPGVPSLAIADNVIPWISGEAEKIESEPRKILGTFEEGRFRPAGDFVLSARVHRVPVTNGHQLSISVETQRPAAPQEVAECLGSFRGEPQERGLPSAPVRPIHVSDRPDRPQPALDRNREGGMAVTVGGIEECPVLGLRFEALSHNTIRGAAGAALLNAELLKARGYLDGLQGG